MSGPLVYAITLNWNRPTDTLDCLESLTCQTYPNLKILAVDNASSDDSVEQIAARFPQLELLVTPRNLGFAGGFNAGLRRALDGGAEYVWIMNNDAVLAPDALETLLQHVSDERGILAPLIYYAQPPDRIWSAGGRTLSWNLERIDPWVNRSDPGDWPEVIEQDFVTGCGMLFSRRVLEQVGLFDEGFHMYYEDSDLCYRMRRAGFRITVVPAAKMWHKVSTSSGGSDAPAERYGMARSSVRFFRKHARGWQILAVLLWRTGSALRTSWRLVRKGRRDSLRGYWRGLLDGLRSAVPPGGQHV